MNYHRQNVEILINKDCELYRRICDRAKKDGVTVEDVVNMALLLRADKAIGLRLDELDLMESRGI